MQQRGLQIPKHINDIGIFSVIVSAGLFVLGAAYWGQLGFGPAPLDTQLLSAFLIALSLAGLLPSLALISIRPRKQLWYALMSFWMLLLVFFTVWNLSRIDSILRSFSEGSGVAFASLVFFGPIIYSAYCIAHFLTKDTKRYFHLTVETPLNLQS